MCYYLILTESIRGVVVVFLRKRINVKEPSNIRLMISPLEGVPIETKIVNVFLPLELNPILNCALALVRIKRQSKRVVINTTFLSPEQIPDSHVKERCADAAAPV